MVSLDLLGTDVGRDGSELVLGCMEVHTGLWLVVTIRDRGGLFVDVIVCVGLLVVCMGLDGASDDRFVGFVVGCGERVEGPAVETKAEG